MADYYLEIKSLHIASAALSFVLYTLRGAWMLTDSRWHYSVFARRVPHWNDALLMTLGIALAIIVHQYPLVNAWLTAKMVALLVHIGLGFFAFRWRGDMRIRAAAWVGSLLAFLYIVAVAVTHNPFPLIT